MIKRILIALAVIAIGIAWTAVPTNAAPPGNDGQLCHGRNQASCRPDPQPSHGQDCQPHGNNQDGNDDHCASTAPSGQPSSEPSSEPSEEPSTEPSSEPSFSVCLSPGYEPGDEVIPGTVVTDEPCPSDPTVDTGGGNEPGVTPPPTDTVATTAEPDYRIPFVILIAIALVGSAVYQSTRGLRQ